MIGLGGGFAAAAALSFEVLEVFVNGNSSVDEGVEVGVDKVGNSFGDFLLESSMDGFDPEVVGVPTGGVTPLLDLVDQEAGAGGLH